MAFAANSSRGEDRRSKPQIKKEGQPMDDILIIIMIVLAILIAIVAVMGYCVDKDEKDSRCCG
jgi:flagellar basal body-associated protein FliL